MALYGIITRDKEKAWVFVNPGPPKSSLDLVKLLNQLGEQGWDVVGVGDFGGGAGDEIILRK
jgi:hypothetical protein